MRRLFLLAALCLFLPLRGEQLTLLTFNICFLPGSYPLQYGGVSPASDRVDRVAQFILEANCDLVALQEAHDYKAVAALTAALEERYPYIIQPVEGENLIFNSGLLIASKYPIEEFSFKSFQYEGMQQQINKGYADFKIRGLKGRVLAHLFVAHLQPGSSARDKELRELELRELIAALKSRRLKSDRYPYIVMGDLNIPWGSDEYLFSSLQSFLYDSYTEGLRQVNLENLTATDYLTDYMQSRVDAPLFNLVINNTPSREEAGSNPYREILDYIALYRGDSGSYVLFNERIPAFSFDKPLEALSDHHALKSTVKKH